MPRFSPDLEPADELPPELPDELAALRAFARSAADGPGDRAERATRSASIFLQERRRRLQRELESRADAGEAATRGPRRSGR